MTLTAKPIPITVVPQRRIPLRLSSRPEDEVSSVASVAAELRPKPAHAARLEESLWNRLSFAKRGASGYPSHEEMYDGYLTVLTTVADKGDQLWRFFEGLARMNVEYRSLGKLVPNTLRRRTLKARTDALVKRMGYEPSGICTEDGYNPRLPLEDCYSNWAQAIRGNIAALVLALYATLDRCVEQEIVGRITWSAPTSCSFTFFREVVVCHDDVRSEWRNGNEVWTGTHTYRHAVHRHEVIEAKEHQGRPRDFFLPQRVGEAWGLVPAWLRPHLRFVTGTQTKERIIERDLGTEAWEHTERDLNALDPAVVLDGGYVLTGWGVLDQKREAGEAPWQSEPTPKRSAWRRLLSFLRVSA
ncbi:MAG TPA: hypothetical protein VEL76_34435 [Gemmataceae bacterium]|nr:hypothetical protein [Gemmataceae bacterium]